MVVCVIFQRHTRREVLMRRCVLFGIAAVMMFASHAYADFYRWVDKDGKEFFSNDVEKVPHEYRSSMKQVKPDESRVSFGEKPVGTGKKVKRESPDHKDKYGRGEEHWRKRATALRKKLWDQQADYSQVVSELKEKDTQTNKRSGKKNRSSSGLEKKKKKLEHEIAKTKRELETDLPEEARRADAYPGWIRE